MSTTKHTEYLAPLGSIDRNNTRRAFLHLGRYHGFDAITPGVGSNIPITILHDNPLQYLNASNAVVSEAVFVTGHGLVITTTETPTVEVLANAEADPVYQVLYASYVWANTAGGASVSYGTGSQLTDEPIAQPSLTPVTRTPLGYFTITAGASDFSGVTYTPYRIPNLAGGPGVDLSGLAKLHENNIFTDRNSFGLASLTATAISASASPEGTSTLTIPPNVNEVVLSGLESISYVVNFIKLSEVETPEDGFILWLHITPCNAEWSFFWGNISYPVGLGVTELTQGGSFCFIVKDGVFILMDAFHSMLKKVLNLTGRVTTLEAEMSSVENRVQVLEGAGGVGVTWEDLVVPNTVVNSTPTIPPGFTSTWKVQFFKRAIINGLTYITTRLEQTSANTDIVTTLGNADLGLSYNTSLPLIGQSQVAPIQDPVGYLALVASTGALVLTCTGTSVLGTVLYLPPTPVSP